MSWNPLFNSLITSSVLHEGPTVLATWALLIASADRYGESDLTIPFVANAMGVPIDDVEKAFNVLQSPDKFSRTQDCDGRRIIRQESGRWFLPAHTKHREAASKALAVDRTTRYRARKAVRDRDSAMPPCWATGCTKPSVGYDLQGRPVCSGHSFREDGVM